MRKATTFVLSAVLGSGIGVAAGQFASAADQGRPDASAVKAAATNPPQLPNGFQMKDLNQLDNIREQMSRVTQEAAEPDNFGKFIKNLAVFNRDRMKDYSTQDFKTFDGVVNQINKDWKDKYGHKFDITAAKEVWTDQYTIVQGVVTNPNVAADNFPVPAEPNREGARVAAGSDLGQAREVEAKDLHDSEGVALVRYMSEHNLPSLTASMIEEGHGKWRYAIPLETTSQQLHARLQDQLTYFGQHASKWPADEAEAYRLAGHRVAMALYGIDVPDERTR